MALEHKKVKPPESLREVYRILKLILESTYKTKVRVGEYYELETKTHHFGVQFYLLDPKKTKLRIRYTLSHEIGFHISPIYAGFETKNPEEEMWDFFTGFVEPILVIIPFRDVRLIIPPKYYEGQRVPGALIIFRDHPSLNILDIVVFGSTPDEVSFLALCEFQRNYHKIIINEIFVGVPLDIISRMILTLITKVS